jgi:hypothetical protein
MPQEGVSAIRVPLQLRCCTASGARMCTAATHHGQQRLVRVESNAPCVRAACQACHVRLHCRGGGAGGAGRRCWAGATRPSRYRWCVPLRCVTRRSAADSDSDTLGSFQVARPGSARTGSVVVQSTCPPASRRSASADASLTAPGGPMAPRSGPSSPLWCCQVRGGQLAGQQIEGC